MRTIFSLLFTPPEEAADTLSFFDEGRVIETGSHAQLLERDGLYAQLHRMQFAA